ncbi:MAG: GspE/PulE family protein [Eubacteriaceae bacterium]|nr:GspE/PulE family protein [Eubacteriaceae bacterium]
MKIIRLGDVLIDYGYVTEEQVSEALEYQNDHKQEGLRLGETLIKLGYIKESEMLRALADRLKIPVIDISSADVDRGSVEKIPKALAKQYNMLAYGTDGNDLKIVTNDPLNMYALEDIKQVSGMKPIVAIDTNESVRNAISKYYSDIGAREALEKASDIAQTLADEIPEIEDVGDDAPIVAALNQLLLLSYNMNASDVHIEPFEEHVLVRVRVDGVMTETARLSTKIRMPLIARIKIMADMDIAERRIPQDGHFKTEIEGRSINARVSVIPTVHGEKAVIRFLFEDVAVDQAANMGMNDRNYEKFAKMVRSPHGMIYITGPTGSGKTTTLYMLLDRMAQQPVNISTIEDPVERDLKAINQMQVNNQSGLTFETGLRALLRQDPDVIMVGETRDSETADIAVRAAITGHLVFSTLHTNDAISAIVRLEDMGVPDYLVANSLVGLVAQRLVRKVCSECGEEYEASPEECALLGVDSAKLKKGRGCPSCNGTGYHGRTAVHEVVVIDREMRRMIAKGAGVEELEKYLKDEGGFISLQEEAGKMVLAGITTIEEYNKVAYNVD